MEFGSVTGLAGIDLSLPPDDPGTAAALAGGKGGGRSRLYVGAPLWNDPELARKLCPPKTPESARLACYAKAFNAVELNSTGYGLRATNAEKWAAATPPGFKFCPKVPRDVSHARKLDGLEAAYDRFVAGAKAFGDRLGPAFLQFPESFGPGRFPELERLLRAQAGKLELAVEVRHRDWFNDAARRDALFGLLRELKMSAVITDVPGRRDLLHQRLTAPWAFVRFSGHDMGQADLARLEDWARALKRWLDAGLEAAWFFPHHEPKHFSVDWCVRSLEALNRVCGTALPVPSLR